MAMKYVKAYYDWLDAMDALSDGERGRLITAVLKYAQTGVAPSLTGAERYVFPSIKLQVDRDAESYEEISEKRKKAGKSGGRPKKHLQANGSKCKQMKANESKCFQDKDQDKDQDQDQDKDKDQDKNIAPKGANTRAKRFSPPSVEDVRAYCLERGNAVDADAFVDFYASKGWRIGQNPMKDWRAAVRTWEKRERRYDPGMYTETEGSL